MTGNVERIKSHILVGGKITAAYGHDRKQPHIEVQLADAEFMRTGTRALGFDFKGAEISPEMEIKVLRSADIQSCRFKPDGAGVTAELELPDGRRMEISLRYTDVECTEFAYNGMSYRNVYDEQMAFNRQFDGVFHSEYQTDRATLPAGEDCELVLTAFRKKVNASSGHEYFLSAFDAALVRNGEELFSYRAWDGTFAQVIRHSSGREYLLFRQSLYGLSVLDMAEKKAYHYIPEGEKHDRDYPCGESFIIVAAHYNPATQLMALDGCFWASPYDVMLADFSDPMGYDPNFVSIRDLVDPDYERLDEIGFSGWGEGYIECESGGKKFTVPVENIRRAMEQRK